MKSKNSPAMQVCHNFLLVLAEKAIMISSAGKSPFGCGFDNKLGADAVRAEICSNTDAQERDTLSILAVPYTAKGLRRIFDGLRDGGSPGAVLYKLELRGTYPAPGDVKLAFETVIHEKLTTTDPARVIAFAEKAMTKMQPDFAAQTKEACAQTLKEFSAAAGLKQRPRFSF